MLLILPLTIIATSCTGNINDSVQDEEKQTDEFDKDSLISELVEDSQTTGFLEDSLTAESEDKIIQLTEEFKPTSLDILLSLKSNNELYMKLNKYYSQITQKEKVVNNLLLRQNLFAVRTECFGGQDLLWTGRRDSVIAWIADVALKQMDMEKPKEFFCADALYYYIEEHPKKVEDYDANLISEISNSLDSCRKQSKED